MFMGFVLVNSYDMRCIGRGPHFWPSSREIIKSTWWTSDVAHHSTKKLLPV